MGDSAEGDFHDALAWVAGAVGATDEATLVAADHRPAGEHPLCPHVAVALAYDFRGRLAAHADHSCSDANASVQPTFSM